METNTFFTILKWWVDQRKQDKIFVLLIFIIATFGLVSFRLYGQKEAIQQRRFEDMRQYEMIADQKAEKALKRSDSLRTADRIDCQNDYQNLLNDKESKTILRTQKISKALK